MNRVLSAIWTIGLTAGLALAGPLNKGWVAADAKWVVHVDVEAAMASTMGKCLMDHEGDLDLKPVKEFEKQTGLDAFKDIKGVTIYGLSVQAEQGVALVVGTDKLEAALNKLSESENKEVQKLVEGGRTIYRWKERGQEKFGVLRSGKGDDRVLVVSESRDELAAAVGVIDGGASLKGEHEGAMAAMPRSGSSVFVVMRGLDAAGAEHAPKILRSVKELTADVGEDGEGVYADVHLKAASPQDLKTLAGYVNGMLAIGKMAIKDEPDLADLCKLMDGVSVEAKDEDLTAKIRISKDQVAAILQEVGEDKKFREGKKIKDKKSPEIEKTSNPKDSSR